MRPARAVIGCKGVAHLDVITNIEHGPDVRVPAIFAGDFILVQQSTQVVIDLHEDAEICQGIHLACDLLAYWWILDLLPLCKHMSTTTSEHFAARVTPAD